jgi:hypothetical protein
LRKSEMDGTRIMAKDNEISSARKRRTSVSKSDSDGKSATEMRKVEKIRMKRTE